MSAIAQRIPFGSVMARALPSGLGLVTLPQIIILIFSAKHFLHGVGLLMTHGTDKIMTTWAIFHLARGDRDVVVAIFLMSSLMGAIGVFASISATGRTIILAPQQILLTLSCLGSLLFTFYGVTPSGVETGHMVLFLRQLPLLVCVIVHFFAMMQHVMDTP